MAAHSACGKKLWETRLEIVRPDLQDFVSTKEF